MLPSYWMKVQCGLLGHFWGRHRSSWLLVPLLGPSPPPSLVCSGDFVLVVLLQAFGVLHMTQPAFQSRPLEGF